MELVVNSAILAKFGEDNAQLHSKFAYNSE